MKSLRDRVRERGLRRQNVLPTNDSPGSTPRSGSRDDGKKSILIKVEGRKAEVEETAAQKVDRIRNEDEGAANFTAKTDLKDAEKRFFFHIDTYATVFLRDCEAKKPHLRHLTLKIFRN